MPCYGPESWEIEAEDRRDREALTRMLCWLCEHTPPSVIEANTTLSSWWRAHRKRDQLRREQEKAEAERKTREAAALAKLTPEERAILGLHR